VVVLSARPASHCKTDAEKRSRAYRRAGYADPCGIFANRGHLSYVRAVNRRSCPRFGTSASRRRPVSPAESPPSIAGPRMRI